MGQTLAEGACARPTMPADRERFVQLVQGTLTDHLHRNVGINVDSWDETVTCHRSYSTISFLQCRTSQGLRRFVAKTTAPHAENRPVNEEANQAVVEFNILSTLYPRFAEFEATSIPEPVLVLPELNTYVMNYVSGEPLANLLRHDRWFASRKEFSRLELHFRRAGLWLKRFQELTGHRAGGPEVLAGIRERCDFRLTLIESFRDPRISADLRKKVLRFLNEQERRLGNTPVGLTGRHVDFGPWNVLARPDGVTVLDFFGYRDDPPVMDLLSMLIALDREKKCLTANRLRVQSLQDSFLAGYGLLPRIQEPLWLMCESLQRICGVHDALNQNHGYLLRRLERHRSLRSNLRWLAGDRRETLLPGGEKCQS